MEDSVNSSELAARNSVEQEETSVLMETGPTPQEWTDEQHCLFLKSMESEFVNQLYKSIDLSGWHSRKSSPANSKSFKHKQMSTHTPSGQFKVFRDGLWSKVDIRKDEPEDDQREEFKVPSLNPWIQRYRSSKLQSSRKFRASCAKAPLATIENQNPANNLQRWRQNSIGSNAEVTDQNFNDEALEEENSDMIHNMKGSRTTDIVSSNDRVVPYDNIVREDDVGTQARVHIPPED